MKNRTLKEQDITDFQAYLVREEKGEATVEKYIRATREFLVFAGETPVTKELAIAWKELLVKNCAPRTVNGKLAGLNRLLQFLGWEDYKVKNLKIQQQAYSPEEKELTMEEYLRLLEAASGQPQLRLILETIAGTGIRVSELRYFTVEAVRIGEIRIDNKGKNRVILLPDKLKRKLREWAKAEGIASGAIFLSRSGSPLSRSLIWLRMKKLCETAGVAASKVFPHNLRKLFARRFYEVKEDIAKLADVLGHSNINTTRIYIMTTGVEHRRILNQLGLVV